MNDFVQKRLRAWFGRPVKASSSLDVSEVSGAIATTVGEVRAENQDRAAIIRFSPTSPDQQAFVLALLCDGMGGMAEGKACAEIAASVVLDRLLKSRDRDISAQMRAAVDAANSHLFGEFRGRGGTTVVAVLFTASDAIGLSVGDSRLYVRSKDGRLKQISVDDTIAGELSRLKGESPQTDELEPFSKQLAQFVGMGDNMEPRMYSLDMSEANPYYVLSSDGAHAASHSVFESIFRYSPSQQIALGRVIHLSNWCGGADNATLISITANVRPALDQATNRTGLLEIWDSFGKLELLFSAADIAGESEQMSAGERSKEVIKPRARAEKSRKTKRKSAAEMRKETRAEGRERTTTDRPQRTFEIQVGTADLIPPKHEAPDFGGVERADKGPDDASPGRADSSRDPEDTEERKP